MLTLYTNPMSRGRIARWMLEEAGADYDVRVRDFGADFADPAFLAINPMGKVPAIVHDDQVVTEAAAICAYLAEAFPDAGLAPLPAERAAYLRWMFFAAGPLEQAISFRSLEVTPAPEKSGFLGFGDYDRTVAALEQAVSATPFIAGERFTAADVYVGSHVLWGQAFGTLPARDAFAEYGARVSDRSAYRRANELDDALMPVPEAVG